MAEERDETEHTEDPTPKRLEEAIKRGDVVKSIEVSTWFMIAGGTLMLMVFAGPMATSLEMTLRGVARPFLQISRRWAGAGRSRQGAGDACACRARHSVSAADACRARSATRIQHRIVFSVEPLIPHCRKSRRRPGFKRLFSKQALANFAKGLIKLTLFGAVIAALLWPQRFRLGGLVATDPAMILPFTRSLAMQMLGTVVAILAVVAAADYLFQYRQWYDRQKMSFREMKEEFRQTEGDPAIKGKIRQLRHGARAQAHDGRRCRKLRWSSPTRPISPSRCNTSAA